MAPTGSYGPKTSQYGSLWPIGVYAAHYGLILLQIALMALLAPKILNMDNMDQYRSLWLIRVCAAHYGSIWLQMALHGSNC